MLNIFEISRLNEIVESWKVYWRRVSSLYSTLNVHPIMFLSQSNKTKLVPASFSYFLELLWKKNKI